MSCLLDRENFKYKNDMKDFRKFYFCFCEELCRLVLRAWFICVGKCFSDLETVKTEVVCCQHQFSHFLVWGRSATCSGKQQIPSTPPSTKSELLKSRSYVSPRLAVCRCGKQVAFQLSKASEDLSVPIMFNPQWRVIGSITAERQPFGQ